MANNFVFLQGKVKWCRPHVLDPKFNKYSTVLYLTPEARETMLELQTQGVKNQMKKDEDGYFMTFSRPGSKTYIDKDGAPRVRAFTPPLVLDKDGKTPLNNINIGNGSDCTLKIEVYEHRVPGGSKAKAVRWESIRVDNLVPFDGKKDFTEGEAGMAKGVEDAPEQLF